MPAVAVAPKADFQGRPNPPMTPGQNDELGRIRVIKIGIRSNMVLEGG